MYCMHVVRDCIRWEVMTLKPRYVHPQTFRESDKGTLDAAILIAKNEGSNLTAVIRDALKVYVTGKIETFGIRKIDDFLNNSISSDPIYNRLLTPKELRQWPDNNLLDFAKHLKSRKDEIDSELRHRGLFIRW